MWVPLGLSGEWEAHLRMGCLAGVKVACKEAHLDRGFILFSVAIAEGFLCLMMAHKVRLWKFPISKTDQGPGKATESVGTLKCQWAFPFFWTLHWRNPSSWEFTVSSMVPLPHKQASFILKHEAWGISWKWHFYSVNVREERYCVEQT